MRLLRAAFWALLMLRLAARTCFVLAIVPHLQEGLVAPIPGPHEEHTRGDWSPSGGYSASGERTQGFSHPRLVALAAVVIVLEVQPAEALAPGLPPLAKSPNVQHLGNVPTGPALGRVLKDK